MDTKDSLDSVLTLSSSTERLVERGAHNLRYGKYLLSTIDIYGELRKRESGNPRWQIFQACAMAQRACSLTNALEDAKNYKPYDVLYKKWKETVTDRRLQNLQRYRELPPPEQPDLPRTRDDNKLFQASEAAIRTISGLSLAAIKLLNEAAEPIARQPAPVQQELLSLKAWTLLAIWKYPKRFVPEAWPKPEGQPVQPFGTKEIADVMQQAMDAAPGDMSVKQSMADLCILLGYTKGTTIYHQDRVTDEERRRQGFGLFEQWVQEAPLKAAQKAAACYRLANLEYEFPRRGSTADVRRSIEANLLQAVRLQPSEARYHYGLACIYAGISPERMLTELERGNAQGRVSAPAYKFSCPISLEWVFPDGGQLTRDLFSYFILSLANTVDDAAREESKRLFNVIKSFCLVLLRSSEYPGLPAEQKRRLQTFGQVLRDNLNKYTKW